jgi:hypothetical protein
VLGVVTLTRHGRRLQLDFDLDLAFKRAGDPLASMSQRSKSTPAV